MSKLDTWTDNKIVQNGFVWLCFFFILLTTIHSDSRVVTSIYILLLLAPPVYLNNLVILPFFKKKKLFFFSLFIANTFLFSVISVAVIVIVSKEPFQLDKFINFMGIMLLALIFASTIKIARDSFTRRQQEKEAELKLLKAQLNPHFLFNTLNNLYGLSVTKSDKLPDLMLKLSDLLRYSLYETKEILVPLEKENRYLENYIALEKIRLEDQTEIIFDASINDETIKIAPMLLIVFVENAFKHLNISEGEKSRVAVSIEVKGHQLLFKCVNTFDDNQYKENTIEKGKSGIGLNNAKKRLALIYPETHQLKIEKSKGFHSVELTINI